MSNVTVEKVTQVHHWNDTLFSFKCTRQESLRFINGQFVMIGLEVNGKPLMRAYSIVSANYDDHLEFLSIKVQDGPLTSRLQHLKVGDPILVGKKCVGTLVQDNLLPGKNLYLFATGTGLAPFMSIIKDHEVYDRYEKIVLIHGVRWVSELAYEHFISEELPNNEYFGDMVKEKLIYYPTVTREPYRNTGRLTDLIVSGKLCKDIGLPQLNPVHDRGLMCGSPSMLTDLCKILNGMGFKESPGMGEPGDYAIERAFVEK